jgi:hypothetical protein
MAQRPWQHLWTRETTRETRKGAFPSHLQRCARGGRVCAALSCSSPSSPEATDVVVTSARPSRAWSQVAVDDANFPSSPDEDHAPQQDSTLAQCLLSSLPICRLRPSADRAHRKASPLPPSPLAPFVRIVQLSTSINPLPLLSHIAGRRER